MQVKDILNQQVTVIKAIYDENYNAHTSIGNVLFNLCPRWKEHITNLRNILNTQGDTTYKKAKIHTPAWFPHGTVFGGTRDDNMASYTNIIAIDIDVKPGENDTLDVEWLRREMYKQPYVFAALKSLSGKGIYILVYVKDHNHTKEYYRYFYNMLLHKYNVKIDMSATNIARKRFIAWEKDMDKWIKPMDTDITPWSLYISDEVNKLFKDKPIPQHNVRRHTSHNLFNTDFTRERTKEAITKAITLGQLSVDYFTGKSEASMVNVWWHIGNEIKYFFGDVEGEQLFVQFSQNTSKYNDDYSTIKSQYERCDADKAIDGKYTKTEDELHSKWQGIAKHLLGERWWFK